MGGTASRGYEPFGCMPYYKATVQSLFNPPTYFSTKNLLLRDKFQDIITCISALQNIKCRRYEVNIRTGQILHVEAMTERIGIAASVWDVNRFESLPEK